MTLGREDVKILAISVFVVHGCLQHAGAGWAESSCLRFRANFFASLVSRQTFVLPTRRLFLFIPVLPTQLMVIMMVLMLLI